MSVKLEYLINQHIQEKRFYVIQSHRDVEHKQKVHGKDFIMYITSQFFYWVHKSSISLRTWKENSEWLINIIYLFDSILFSIAIVTKPYYKCMVIWKVGKRNNAPKTQREMYFWYPICYVLVYEWMGKTHTAIIYSF